MGGIDSLRQKGVFLRGLSLFLLLTWPRSSAGRNSQASLFEFSEHVLELNPDSFGLKAGSTEPWVVNCYSPGCPHCTRFAPTVSVFEMSQRNLVFFVRSFVTFTPAVVFSVKIQIYAYLELLLVHS